VCTGLYGTVQVAYGCVRDYTERYRWPTGVYGTLRPFRHHTELSDTIYDTYDTIYDTYDTYDTIYDTYDTIYDTYDTYDTIYDTYDTYDTIYDTYDTIYDTYDTIYDTYDTYDTIYDTYDTYDTIYDTYDTYDTIYDTYDTVYDTYDTGLGPGPDRLGPGPGSAWVPGPSRARGRVWPGPGLESTLKITKNYLISWKKRGHVKDGGKSYCQKLRRVMNLLFYDTDNSEAFFKIHFFSKLAKIWKIRIFGPLRN
jgi:hypothetical protein